MRKFTKDNLKALLVVGAKIRLGSEYCNGRGFTADQIITLIEGYFEHDNGLYIDTQTSPSIWCEAQKDFDSIYHLFGNDLEDFLDCEILDSTYAPQVSLISCCSELQANIHETLNIKIHKILYSRYTKLAKGTSVETRIVSMMKTILDNCESWPPDKTGRWTGYVQCLLIEVAGVTSVDAERVFTRPLFHELYRSLGISLPESFSPTY